MLKNTPWAFLQSPWLHCRSQGKWRQDVVLEGCSDFREKKSGAKVILSNSFTRIGTRGGADYVTHNISS
ncbi:hypothetical protein QQF64_009740 [Cirrhinus molitorella]|uniref:Uncharacterized protein n=1 Tax=Cirrhinus molitorella TaxID=172907 RepID=A0ABR3M216_9TELE